MLCASLLGGSRKRIAAKQRKENGRVSIDETLLLSFDDLIFCKIEKITSMLLVISFLLSASIISPDFCSFVQGNSSGRKVIRFMRHMKKRKNVQN